MLHLISIWLCILSMFIGYKEFLNPPFLSIWSISSKSGNLTAFKIIDICNNITSVSLATTGTNSEEKKQLKNLVYFIIDYQWASWFAKNKVKTIPNDNTSTNLL